MTKLEIIEEILRKFFDQAPLHLITPQRQELEQLNQLQLHELLSINQIPISHEKLIQLQKLINGDFLMKFEEKAKTANLIKLNESSGNHPRPWHLLKKN